MIDDRTAEDEGGTVFRDVIFLALLAFVVMVFILILHFNPPTEESDAEPPGNLIVEATWPNEINADVDLWVKGPGERAVGYSNRSSELLDYLRDDLGHHRDPTFINQEFTYSRGLRDGEYIINLHWFRSNDQAKEVPVHVRIRLKPEDGDKIRLLFDGRALLKHPGEEITVVRFLLLNGKVVADSWRQSFIPIRSGANSLYIPRTAQDVPEHRMPDQRMLRRQPDRTFGWQAPSRQWRPNQ